jgi:hypothetical protein
MTTPFFWTVMQWYADYITGLDESIEVSAG